MMKILKKITLLTLLIMFIGVDAVEAYTWGYATAATSDPTTPEEPEEKEPYSKDLEDRIEGDYKYTYSCKYRYSNDTWRDISLNAYDSENNSLLENSLIFDKEYNTLAGTAIGISLIDIQAVSWKIKQEDVWVDVTTYEWKENPNTYICNYEWQEISPPPEECDPTIDRFCVSHNDATQTAASDLFSPLVRTLKNSNRENNKPIPIVRPACSTEEVDDPSKCKEHETQNCKYTNSTPKENGGYWKNQGTTKSTYSKRINECKKIAITEALYDDEYGANEMLTWGAAYKVDLTNSNNINDNNFTIDETEINANASNLKKCFRYSGTSKDETKCKFDEKSNYIDNMVNKLSNGDISDTIYVSREYKKEKTCINVKNGDVSYIPVYENGNVIKSDCDSTTELTIENDTINNEEHWHYFVPLNAKSNSQVAIDLMMNYGGTITENECKYVIEHNPVDPLNPNKTSYVDLVVKLKDAEKEIVENFKGDYYCFDDACNKEVSSDWKFVDNLADNKKDAACRLTTKVIIPIKQGFYNEDITTNESNKEKVAFNGFNFYYKPIDINNEKQVDIIFPNGVNTDVNGDLTYNSLWSNWYKAQTNASQYSQYESPDLSKSYSVVTYYTNGINANAVRTYNKENPYTSWSNMNIDGTSKYISGEGSFITKNTKNTTNIYKLGCGPLNTDEYLDAAKKEKNPLYIKGCDN